MKNFRFNKQDVHVRRLEVRGANQDKEYRLQARIHLELPLEGSDLLDAPVINALVSQAQEEVDDGPNTLKLVIGRKFEHQEYRFIHTAQHGNELVDLYGKPSGSPLVKMVEGCPSLHLKLDASVIPQEVSMLACMVESDHVVLSTTKDIAEKAAPVPEPEETESVRVRKKERIKTPTYRIRTTPNTCTDLVKFQKPNRLKGSAGDTIISYLSKFDEPVRMSRICRETGLVSGTVGVILKREVDSGKIKKVKRGLYKLKE